MGVQDLDGKRAIVTGGAAGIGRAIAEALAREGARVIVAELNSEAALSAAKGIGRGASSLTIDVAKRASDESAVEFVAETWEKEIIQIDDDSVREGVRLG